MPRHRKTGSVAGEDLRKRWRVALADFGTTERAWAIARGFSASHVRQVVLGKRESELLLQEIVAWVYTREKMIVKRITAATAA